jgi:hypothetical protein
MDENNLVAYEDVDAFPADGEEQILRILADYDIHRYPEGALIATFAPPHLDSAIIHGPQEIESNPYIRRIELNEFPPENDRFCNW